MIAQSIKLGGKVQNPTVIKLPNKEVCCGVEEPKSDFCPKILPVCVICWLENPTAGFVGVPKSELPVKVFLLLIITPGQQF